MSNYPDPDTWEQLQIDATTPEDEQDYWVIESEDTATETDDVTP